MKKFLLAIMLSTLAPLTLAAPTLCQISAGATCLEDTGDEVFEINDTDGTIDTITTFTIDRNAGFTNDFGFYDTDDSSNRLSIFSGVSSILDAETITWDGLGYAVLGGAAAIFGSGAEFGVYSENSGGNTWFSQAALNADGLDHWLTFSTLGATPGLLGVMNITFALDDQFGGGDQDFNDLVAGCIDCQAIGGPGIEQVPIPSSLVLMGLGVMVLRARVGTSTG